MAKAKKAAYVKLEGSEKPAPQAKQTGAPNPDQTIEVTVRLRRNKSIERSLKAGEQFSRKEYEERFGAKEQDIKKIQAFAHEHHLAVSNIDKARRSVMLTGSLQEFEAAFQVKLDCYEDENGRSFRGRKGQIKIPQELEGIVEGVFGLDDRPTARPMFQIATTDGQLKSRAAGSTSYAPNEVAKIYGFPANVNGKGQCIAIIELGGGYRASDLKTYFSRLNIPNPSVSAVSVDGAKNSPSTAQSADGEVMLDIEVAGAVAPGANIVVYFAPNTDKGFLDAITQAIHDDHNKPSVISISWGAAEKAWTKQSMTNFNEAFKTAALLGVTICAAAGDQGSSDAVSDGKVHVDFPASSPYILACGGTRLVVNNNTITETVWHDSNSSATGGGISDFFPLPDYQKKTAIPPSLNKAFKGRGLPDVAGNADPVTGYKVLVDGQQMVIGGTSAVAPLMAALIALLNQRNKKPLGFINPQLYANPNLCRDITQGDNITTSTKKGFKAAKGWDACTGWGVLSKL